MKYCNQCGRYTEHKYTDTKTSAHGDYKIDTYECTICHKAKDESTILVELPHREPEEIEDGSEYF